MLFWVKYGEVMDIIFFFFWIKGGWISSGCLFDVIKMVRGNILGFVGDGNLLICELVFRKKEIMSEWVDILFIFGF